MTAYSLFIWHMVEDYFRNEFQQYLNMEKSQQNTYKAKSTVKLNNGNSISQTGEQCALEDYLKGLLFNECTYVYCEMY